MLHSAPDVVTALVGRGEVRYAIQWQKEEQEGDYGKEGYWYEATLDSEELIGTSGALPDGFVLISLCRQGGPSPSQCIRRLAEDLQARQTGAECDTVQQRLKFICTPLSSKYLARHVDRLSSGLPILHLSFPQLRY